MPNDLVQDVLNNRARLISREALANAQVQSRISTLADKWAQELRRAIKRSGGAAGELSDLARKSMVLNKLGKITDQELSSIRSTISASTKEVYKLETFRHAEILNSQLAEASGEVGVSFAQISERAVSAGIRGVITGADEVLGKTSSAVRAQMQNDLAGAIADGWNVNQLAAKWSRMQGASGIAYNRVDALARTALMSASNNAAISQYDENPDISGVRWESAFDLRVCVVCASLSGRVFQVKNAPAMPAHFRCRCVWVPVFKDASLNSSFDTTAYRTPKGTGFKKNADRRFETWLENQPEIAQRQFFPSVYKFQVWDNGKASLDQMVNLDGTIKSDGEVKQIITRGGSSQRNIQPQAPLGN